jgi:hypothetical protein
MADTDNDLAVEAAEPEQDQETGRDSGDDPAAFTPASPGERGDKREGDGQPAERWVLRIVRVLAAIEQLDAGSEMLRLVPGVAENAVRGCA